MARRLRVRVPEEDLRTIERLARTRGLTPAAWAGDALRAALQKELSCTLARKLAVVRTASLRSFPTADLEQMLIEIEGG